VPIEAVLGLNDVAGSLLGTSHRQPPVKQLVGRIRAALADLAKAKDGWAGKGHAEWGDFRFGHTHPGYSNSGLIAVLAENYAAVGKAHDLEPSDIEAPKTKAFLALMQSLGIQGSALFVSDQFDEYAYKSARNLPNVTMKPAMGCRSRRVYGSPTAQRGASPLRALTVVASNHA